MRIIVVCHVMACPITAAWPLQLQAQAEEAAAQLAAANGRLEEALAQAEADASRLTALQVRAGLPQGHRPHAQS